MVKAKQKKMELGVLPYILEKMYMGKRSIKTSMEKLKKNVMIKLQNFYIN